MDQKKQMKFQNGDVLGKHRKQVGENGVLRELKRRPLKYTGGLRCYSVALAMTIGQP